MKCKIFCLNCFFYIDELCDFHGTLAYIVFTYVNENVISG